MSRGKQSAIPAQALGDLVGVMFDVTAARRGDYWRLSPDEKHAVGDALANVIRHVPLPERELGIAADVAALGFVFYAVTMPRLEADRQRAIATGGTATGTVPPSPPPPRPVEPPRIIIDGVNDADTLGTPSPLDNGLDELIRTAFPDGMDLSNPEHVAKLNEIAGGGTIGAGP